VAKVRRHDIYFYLGMAFLIVFAGLSVWVRFKGNQPDSGVPRETLQSIQAAQVACVVLCLVFFIISFRQPLRRMNANLFRERQELAREKRRKKAHQ
jgi:hypothetical protein